MELSPPRLDDGFFFCRSRFLRLQETVVVIHRKGMTIATSSQAGIPASKRQRHGLAIVGLFVLIVLRFGVPDASLRRLRPVGSVYGCRSPFRTPLALHIIKSSLKSSQSCGDRIYRGIATPIEPAWFLSALALVGACGCGRGDPAETFSGKHAIVIF
jgi:hypothetical protein